MSKGQTWSIEEQLRRDLQNAESVNTMPAMVWHVENMKLVKMENKVIKEGFYDGDSYVILDYRKDKTNKKQPVLHILHGKNASTDELFFAATKAIAIDDEYFGGKAKQTVQFQENETKELMSLFGKENSIDSVLRWRTGGVESALKNVDSLPKDPTELWLIKGKRKTKAKEVAVAGESLTCDDCFVLVSNSFNIYAIIGSKANKYERLAASELANDIKDGERAGRAHVKFVSTLDLNDIKKMSSDEDVMAIRRLLKAGRNLGLGEKPSLISDEEAEEKYRGDTKLYRVSDAAGEIQEIGERPLTQKLLDENDCFILVTPDGNVYVWKGRKASSEERKQAFLYGLKAFKESTNIPLYASVELINQFSEPASFRSYFHDWVTKSQTVGLGTPYVGVQLAKLYTQKADASKFHDKPAVSGPPDAFKEDDGRSKEVGFYRVTDGGKVQCNTAAKGIFFSGDSYLVVYTYRTQRGQKKSIIYFWKGNDSRVFEKGAAAKLTVDLDNNNFGGDAVQVEVNEGKEPPHFLRIFGGHLIVYQGDYENPDEFKHKRLFQVRGKRENEARVVEVAGVDASYLNSNDTFVLINNSSTIIWKGKGSTGDEVEAAKEAAKIINPQGGDNYDLFEEGREATKFWEILGGKKPYANNILLQSSEAPEPRLFHCYNKRGSLEVEEIVNFGQDDLVDDDVMFVDLGDHIYMWVGEEAKKSEVDETQEFIKEYIASDPTPRNERSFVITRLRAGAETDDFKAFFGVWEDHRTAAKGMSIEEMKELQEEVNKQIDLSQLEDVGGEITKFYPYTELKVNVENLPEDVDPALREEYLEDHEFKELFGMSKGDFRSLREWKRRELRKDKGLF
ncbi:advillin [Nematostella vectensis]|uniref:advillin n=1 Tax=Nematostella vectensis TaxID=45351 RepID=UPI0020771815|nr:advillin [Nematostella vectensis]XP_032241141.2 advillin [Nematostella vectensis]